MLIKQVSKESLHYNFVLVNNIAVNAACNSLFILCFYAKESASEIKRGRGGSGSSW